PCGTSHPQTHPVRGRRTIPGRGGRSRRTGRAAGATAGAAAYSQGDSPRAAARGGERWLSRGVVRGCAGAGPDRPPARRPREVSRVRRDDGRGGPPGGEDRRPARRLPPRLTLAGRATIVHAGLKVLKPLGTDGLPRPPDGSPAMSRVLTPPPPVRPASLLVAPIAADL